MENNTNIKKNYKKAPLSEVHIRVLVAVILGQIACGFALGISGTALTNASKYIQINSLWTGLIGAGSLIGLAGSIVVGRLSDKIGRRKLLMINMYILAGLTLLHLLTANFFLTFLLRIGIGLMIAIDYTVGNALLTEWLPKGEDSKRQSHLLIYWTIGFIASYITGSLIDGFGVYTWQIILTTGAIPALIAALFRSLFPLPASPSWLASRGKVKTANKVIDKHLGRNWGISPKLKHIKPVKSMSWTILFSRKYIRQTLVGGLFYACQAFAFFGISIFLPILLQSMNISNPTISGILYNGGIFIGVLLGIIIFNRISRRSFLINNFLFSGILIGGLALIPQISSILKLLIFSAFSIILSSGLVFDYSYPTELFDIKVRATGVGTCITISRIGAAAGTFLLPILTDVGGANLAMLVCAVVLLFAFLICLIWAPETSPKFIKNTK
ncbi:MFS transporter [Lactobacillus acetotolerans]|uniref:MFS transporter n=1 Tax=Lactobacillus acetotolerans TaxID=1600 RepID=UPI0019D31BD1|nr:MFS transporter [Lactobacillus acetotolerans]MBN7276594.1 MFS transporter [Lactobacillus acetotolerans]